MNAISVWRSGSAMRCRSSVALGVVVTFLLSGCLDEDGSDGPSSVVPTGPVEGIDIALLDFQVPATAQTGHAIQASFTLASVGTEPARGVEVRFGLVHAPAPDSVAERLDEDYVFAVLEPGERRERQVSLPLRGHVGSGDYRIVARAVTSGDVRPENDWASVPIHLNGADCQPDPFETDNRREDAGPISVGERQARNFCNDSNDWATFDAQAGERFLARVMTSMESNPELEIYHAEGQLLGRSFMSPVHWSEDHRNRRILFEAPDTGTYFLRAALNVGLRAAGAGTEYSLELHSELPELRIWAFSGPSEPIPAGGTGQFLLALQNMGWPSDAFEVAFFLSESPDNRGVEIGRRQVLPLDTHETYHAGWWPTIPAMSAPGTWYVRVLIDPDNTIVATHPAEREAGPLSIEVVPPDCAPDAYEENDHPTEATPISLQEPQIHNHCDDHLDWLAFDVEAGATYHAFMVAASGSPLRPRLELYDADGRTRLAQKDGTASTGLTFTAETTGRVFLLATDQNRAYGADRDYGVLIDPDLPDLSVSKVFGSASFPQIDTVQGGLVGGTVSVRNRGHASAPDTTVALRLRAEDGPEEVEVLRLVVPAFSGTTESVDVLMPVPDDIEPGEWALVAIVDPDGEVLQLGYAEPESEPIPSTILEPPCAPDAFEPDDLPEQAKPIDLGEVQSRNHCDDAIDWVRLDDLEADAPYLVQMTREGVGADRTVSVFDEAGDERLFGPANSHMHGRLFFRPPADGSYLLRAGDTLGPRNNSTYTLTVDLCPPLPETSDPPIPISPGQSHRFNLCNGASDVLIFEATVGETYVIETSDLEPNIDPYMDLYGPEGNLLASNNRIGPNNPNARIQWTAEEDGPHRVEIWSWDWGFESGYTISLELR